MHNIRTIPAAKTAAGMPAVDKSGPAEIMKPAARPRAGKERERGMEKTLQITGMMCPRCEARVKKALEGVSGAGVSHREGCARVALTAPLPDDILRKAAEEKGHQVTAIA